MIRIWNPWENRKIQLRTTARQGATNLGASSQMKSSPKDPYNLLEKLRVIPDWPKKGVNFIDVTTLLKDPDAFHRVVDVLTDYFRQKGADVVVGIEARGLMIGAPVAYNLGVGFVPARKKGKLPAEKVSTEYTLEYSSELLEMHVGSISPRQRVGLIDDLLSTGGTAEAAIRLIEEMGGIIAGLGFIVELDFLKGREKLSNYELLSLAHVLE